MRDVLAAKTSVSFPPPGLFRPSSSIVLITALSAGLGGMAVAADASSASAAPKPDMGVSLEEVTVTARKTAERLIDVPVVASVMNAEPLQRYNTTDLEQLNAGVPGVQIYHADGMSFTRGQILMNASLKLYDQDRKREMALMGTNLTDAIHADPYANKPLGNPGDLDAYFYPPREVTLQITRHL